jgi:TetR/AcrR family transcriptional regulator
MGKIKKDLSTEGRILAAAKKVFMSRGMAGARMQDIADEAGINKALLHYYFRNKQKLFEMIFKETFIRFWPRINIIFESDLPLFEKIESFCREYISMIIQNPYLPSFILNEMNQQSVSFHKKIWPDGPPKLGNLVRQIEMEIKAGKIKPISAPHFIFNMISMCVFPFVGRPMLQMAMGLNDLQFSQLMEQRKKEVPAFIIESIRK